MHVMTGGTACGIDIDARITTYMATQHAAFKMAGMAKSVFHLVWQPRFQYSGYPEIHERTDHDQDGQSQNQVRHEGKQNRACPRKWMNWQILPRQLLQLAGRAAK
jgi:hypothetical protein